MAIRSRSPTMPDAQPREHDFHRRPGDARMGGTDDAEHLKPAASAVTPVRAEALNLPPLRRLIAHMYTIQK